MIDPLFGTNKVIGYIYRFPRLFVERRTPPYPFFVPPIASPVKFMGKSSTGTTTTTISSSISTSSTVSSSSSSSLLRIQECIQDLQYRLQLLGDPIVRQGQEKYFKHVLPFRGIKMPQVEECVEVWIKDTLLPDNATNMNGNVTHSVILTPPVTSNTGILRPTTTTTSHRTKGKESSSSVAVLSSRPIYLSPNERLTLMLELIKQNYAEDKLSGIFIGNKVLIKSAYFQNENNYLAILDQFTPLFHQGYIQDWGICDGFCGKILGPWIKSTLKVPLPVSTRGKTLLSSSSSSSLAITSSLSTDTYANTLGEAIGKHLLLEWSRAGLSIWQNRASVVAFVNMARFPDETIFPSFSVLIEQACQRVLLRNERFLQTGAGWVIREISKGDQKRGIRCIRNNLPYFTNEGLRYSMEKLPSSTVTELKHEWKKTQENMTTSSIGNREKSNESKQKSSKSKGLKRKRQDDEDL